jgi:hypothetical protein
MLVLCLILLVVASAVAYKMSKKAQSQHQAPTAPEKIEPTPVKEESKKEVKQEAPKAKKPATKKPVAKQSAKKQK